MGTKFKLGMMMFLQYAIWGAWYPALSAYLQQHLGFSGTQVGVIYSLMPLATIVAPFFGGQLADRYFSTQNVLAVLQLIGGVFLLVTSGIDDYTSMIWMMLIYSMLYTPTLALTNSLTFHHLTDSEREFGWVRVGGTIGWIAVGLVLSGWRVWAAKDPSLALPGDTLVLAGIMSIIMGFFSFTLPKTPPQKKSGSPLAFLEALKMLKNPNTLVFFILTFVVTTELMFYYVLTGPYLISPKIGVSSEMLSGIMVIAQVAEIFVMAILLPYYLPRHGMRKTMTLGILAWPIRYIIFAIGAPKWLVIASLSLHGFCYVFFFTAAQIYVDTIAPRDIRASAQSLYAIINLGLGMYVGSLFAGWVQNVFSDFDTAGRLISTNWTQVFIVPIVLTVVCAAVFLLTFKEKKQEPNTTNI